MSLEEILADWEKVRPMYESLGESIAESLKTEVSHEGIYARIIHRPKSAVSVAKKLYREGITRKNYDEMTDKSGVRAICRFREDTSKISECIRRRFHAIKEEDKSSLLEFDKFGYRSLHFDVKFRENEEVLKKKPDLDGLMCEIQVRTFCEDAWAEINHDLGYKPLAELPEHLKRQIYCLAAILEIADDSFSGININLMKSPILDENSTSRILESHFFRLFELDYDQKLTFACLKTLLPIYQHKGIGNFEKEIHSFVIKNESKIRSIFSERKDKIYSYPFLSQPEIILIFYLLDSEPINLRSRWENAFPIRDLETFAIWWGKPLENIEES